MPLLKGSVGVRRTSISFVDYLDGLTPTHWWKFEEAAAPFADFGAGTNSPRGIGGGTPVLQVDVAGYPAVDLDGVNEWLDRDSAAETITDSVPFSVFAIVKPDAFPASGARVILSTSIPGQSAFNRGLVLGVANGGVVYSNLALASGTAITVASAGGAITTGAHAIGYTWDGTTVRIFVDGVQVASGAYSGGVDHGALAIGHHLGNTTTSLTYFDGKIAHLAWWNNTTISAGQHGQLHTLSGI